MSPHLVRRLMAVLVIVTYVFIAAQFTEFAAWPAGCDPDESRRRMVAVMEYVCSRHLLGGGAIDLIAFGAIWAGPLVALAVYFTLWRHKDAA